jgi:hypothetical protein
VWECQGISVHIHEPIVSILFFVEVPGVQVSCQDFLKCLSFAVVKDQDQMSQNCHKKGDSDSCTHCSGLTVLTTATGFATEVSLSMYSFNVLT